MAKPVKAVMVATPGPDFRLLFESGHGLALAVLPHAPFQVVAVTDAFVDALRVPRTAIVGRSLADALRDLLGADDGALADSLRRVLATGAPDAMGVVDNDDRHLRPVTVPVVREGTIVYLVHRLDDVTTIEDELRRTRARLAETSKERSIFAAFAEHSSDFIGIANAQGVPVYVNPAGRAMVGLSPDFPIESTTIPDYYPSASRGFVSNVIVPTVNQKGRWRGETTFRHWQTDEEIPVSDEHFVIRDPDSDEVLGMGTITRDISDRREVEAIRRRAFEHVRGIVDIAEEAIVSVDDDFRIVLFNTSAERCFGYRAAEVLGGPVDILLPERYRPRHREQIAEFAAETTGLTLQKHSRTVLGMRKNGEEFPAEAAISRVTVDGQSLFNAVMRDVTEQRRLETEERFLVEAGATLLAEATGDEAALAGLGRLIVERFADVFMVKFTSSDVPRPELVVEAKRTGTFGEHARRAQLRASADAMMNRVLDDHHPVIVADLTPGTETPAPFLALPLLLHGESIGVMACIGRPGSRAYDERDLRLGLRIADLAALASDNARLHQATRLAVLARDEIVGIVAHDLRSPLSTILLASRLLRRPGTEPERRSGRNLELIERSAARMNRLIEDLLDVVRVDSKSLTVRRDKLASNELVREILDGHRAAATSAQLDLVLECATHLPPVSADHDRVLQVFDNLIANAIKFTPTGGRIVIGASPRESEVVFSVADTGMGIDAESLPHVFDRFWQARREDRRGVGLGLPIVRGIVEAHGGHIWVESQAGMGTRFAFTLPRAD